MTVTPAPFANVVWIDGNVPFRAERNGWYPSLGVGILSVYDLVRLDVARGLRGGRWTFGLDIHRDFWPIL
jgi:hypothetical protein